MREIKFRGLTLTGQSGSYQQGGQWVYGFYCVNRFDEHTIFIEADNGKGYAHAVRPESVGQFTGLKDKNGKEIYEGDVLQFNARFHEETKTPPVLDKVEFIQGQFLPRPYKGEDVEIIGNIYQNPELLK